MSVLRLVWRVRQGTPVGELPQVTRREYLDFVVDDKSLGDALGVSDCVSWLADWANLSNIEELLPEGRAELESEIEGCGRRLLYVCPECGDVYCGAMTGVIEQEAGRVVWKDFAWLSWDWAGDGGPVFDAQGLEHVGPFYFDLKQYVDTLTNRPPHSTLHTPHT
jgi:hypothetical protein